MNLAGFLSVFWVISSVGAAKKEGEDDWVHLPNKCEGKLSVGVSSVRFSEEGPRTCRGPEPGESRGRAGGEPGTWTVTSPCGGLDTEVCYITAVIKLQALFTYMSTTSADVKQHKNKMSLMS